MSRLAPRSDPTAGIGSIGKVTKEYLRADLLQDSDNLFMIKALERDPIDLKQNIKLLSESTN